MYQWDEDLRPIATEQLPALRQAGIRDLEGAYPDADPAKWAENIREKLTELNDARALLRELIQEYRTPHEMSPDEMEDIVDRAEDLTGYSYDPEKDHREQDEDAEEDEDDGQE